jgi:LPXTG-motif cell wall-anchored protein
MTAVCNPTGGTLLGNLTIVEGVPPTPPTTVASTPTTTTSATATPTPSSSPKASSAAKNGKAAKGTVPFTCLLSINPTPFDYMAATTMSGYRAKASDDVSLVATMSDLPGMSPVPIQGSMDYTLDAKVGGEKVTLKSTGDVNAQPKAVVPVKDLSGSVDAEGDELAVVVTGFTFNFPSGGVGGKCTADSFALSKMTVGSEPIDTDSASSSTTTGTTTTGGTTTALPKTGGGDSMPVVALWALALTLLGVAGLLCVPRTRRQH